MCYSGKCPNEQMSGDCKLSHDEMIAFHESLEMTEPAADQQPPMLRLHLMTGAELMEMVERIANRRREFVKRVKEVNTARVGDKQSAAKV